MMVPLLALPDDRRFAKARDSSIGCSQWGLDAHEYRVDPVALSLHHETREIVDQAELN
jgi:hypothetical protein